MIDNRCSLVLNTQEKICINGKEYLIKEEIGRGASCICYAATSCENGLNYILKEFYPLTCAKRNVDMKIVAKSGATEEFLQCKEKFENLYDNNLTIQKAHKNLFVEPNYELSGNGYIIMPARDLCTLSEWVSDNIPQDSANNTVIDGYLNNALNILHSIADQLEIYQNNNIIHFDIKPDNIFVFKENNGYFARIIDFDSMMTFSEIEELLDKNQLLKLYSTANCYGEETRASFYAKLKDGFSEKWKQLDVYPLGRLCTFILTGNKIPDIDDFTEDSSFLVSNKSDTVNIRKYVFDRFIDKLTAGFGNRYSDAATVKFVVENLQTFMSCYGYFDNQLKYRKDIVPDLLCNKISYETKGALSPLENLIKSENIFENKQSLLLVAECGMGKSTALRKLYLDAILFNQSKYRFVYYPLRKCGSEEQAKNLEKNVFALSLIDKNNTVVLLDAFDETVSEEIDDGACREKLVAEINAICETNSVILTSRIEVKNLRSVKKVTCQPKDFSDSELLKRIQENSPWVKSLHGDMLANPLYVIMAEGVSHIDDYAQYEKAFNKNRWNLIKEQLLGEIYEDEYGKEQLKINYAGELIYNYYLLRILSQFTDNRDIRNAIVAINALSTANPAELETYMRNLGLLPVKYNIKQADNGYKTFAENNSGVCNSFERDMFLFIMRYCNVFTNAYKSGPQVHVNLWDMPQNIENLICSINCLSEVCGCLYNKDIQLSAFQETRRDNLQKLIDFCKTESSLNTNILCRLFFSHPILRNLDFSGMDLSFVNVFHTLEKCKFDGCKMFVRKGNFVDCSFESITKDSFFSPEIMEGFCYVENGNILTKDKKTLVQVATFDDHMCFANLSNKTISLLKNVIVNAFSDLECNEIVIPESIHKLIAFSQCHKVCNTLHITKNTRITNFDNDSLSKGTIRNLEDVVDNIVIDNSVLYEEYGGCIYKRELESKQIKDEEGNCYRTLLWINQCESISFYDAIIYPIFRSFKIKPKSKWKNVRLPSLILPSGQVPRKKMYTVEALMDQILHLSSVEMLDNLPLGYKIVNGFVLNNDKIVFDLERTREFLFLPDEMLENLYDFLSKDLPSREKGFVFFFNPAPYKYLVITRDFFSRKSEPIQLLTEWLTYNMNKLVVMLVGRNNAVHKDVLEYVATHILILDELEGQTKKEIEKQLHIWDNYYKQKMQI